MNVNTTSVYYVYYYDNSIVALQAVIEEVRIN